MSYRVKRIDPYWIKNPVLPAAAALGVGAALILIGRQQVIPAIVAAAVGGIAVILSTKPAVSAVVGSMGVLGGLMTFVLMPTGQNAAMSLPMRLVSTLLFTLFYTVLMDGIVLLVSVLYNFAAETMGLGGLSLDLEDAGEGEA